MKIDQRTKEVTLTEAEYYSLVNNQVSDKLEEEIEKEAQRRYHDTPSYGQFGTGDYEPAEYLGEERDLFTEGALWAFQFQKHIESPMISKDLETEVNNFIGNGTSFKAAYTSDFLRCARHFANWQKENLWKPADGDDLPEIDREVIVLTQPYPLENSEYVVSFAHIPNPDGWDGKSLTSGKVEHYTPKTYGKGGWNIPNIVYWLDVELPKQIKL